MRGWLLVKIEHDNFSYIIIHGVYSFTLGNGTRLHALGMYIFLGRTFMMYRIQTNVHKQFKNHWRVGRSSIMMALGHAFAKLMAQNV